VWGAAVANRPVKPAAVTARARAGLIPLIKTAAERLELRPVVLLEANSRRVRAHEDLSPEIPLWSDAGQQDALTLYLPGVPLRERSREPGADRSFRACGAANVAGLASRSGSSKRRSSAKAAAIPTRMPTTPPIIRSPMICPDLVGNEPRGRCGERAGHRTGARQRAAELQGQLTQAQRNSTRSRAGAGLPRSNRVRRRGEIDRLASVRPNVWWSNAATWAC